MLDSVRTSDYAQFGVAATFDLACEPDDWRRLEAPTAIVVVRCCAYFHGSYNDCTRLVHCFRNRDIHLECRHGFADYHFQIGPRRRVPVNAATVMLLEILNSIDQWKIIERHFLKS